MFHRIPRLPRTLALIAGLAAVPVTALAADQIGVAGFIDSIELNDDSAEAYLQFHGRIFIAVSKQSTEEYRWGGTSCGTRVLSEGQVSHLIHAVDGGLKVTPRYVIGQGSVRCLIGFTFAS